MGKKNAGRRRSRVSIPTKDPSENSQCIPIEDDPLNPVPAFVSLEIAEDEQHCIVTELISPLEMAPSKWKIMASSLAQCVALVQQSSLPRLCVLAPLGIPCQICRAVVRKPHVYLPKYYLADGPFSATITPLEKSPTLALSVQMIPLDGDSESLVRAAAIRKTLPDLFVVDEQVLLIELMGDFFQYRIRIRNPPKQLDACYHVTSRTEIIVSTQEPSPLHRSPSDDRFEGIGGLELELESIRNFAKVCLHQSDLLENLQIPVSCKGLLLHGFSELSRPPGTGKTLIATQLARALGAALFPIDGSDCLSGVVGDSEANLQQIFRQAVAQAPSIIFLDEIDILCPKARSESAESAMSARIVSTLSRFFDSISNSSRVLVLGATNRPSSVDSSLRRPGRFDREILIGAPNPANRLSILRVIIDSLGDHDITEEDVQYVAETAHGFVGADLRALVQEAAISAIRQNSSRCKGRDLLQALNVIKPSALRENIVEVPKVYWTDIGGQDEAKAVLREVVEWPLKFPKSFQRLGIRPPRGVLLYGPPGCSKTMMARALATESSLNFIAVKGPELLSKWVGDSEKALRDVFVTARAASPAIVFFDEIDSIACARSGMGGGSSGSSVGDRVLSQLLIEMDGIESHGSVIVVAATNRPGSLDPALLRPGRLDRLCYVSLPDHQARAQILKIHLYAPFVDIAQIILMLIYRAKYALAEPVDYDTIAEKTDGYSGAELGAICREAAMKAMEDFELTASLRGITKANLENALNEARPRTSPESVQYFETFSRIK